jgi:glutamine amidotransferase/cyclase
VVKKFTPSAKFSVPQMGWNSVVKFEASEGKDGDQVLVGPRMYFVHSFRASVTEQCKEWVLSTTNYAGENYVSSVRRGQIWATQFHPEKSGEAGLKLIQNFVEGRDDLIDFQPVDTSRITLESLGLSKRVVSCLDVRSNDDGDLVVTKGDQYDVREKADRAVRNMGKPVKLAQKYFEQGVDELVFLNITSFREFPTTDAPMLELVKMVSQSVFVPLTIGGGIRDYTDSNGRKWTALEVADAYFRGGADKVSIGSDAVYIAEEFYKNNETGNGSSAIETISYKYGRQAVVISLDPKRVWVTENNPVPAFKPSVVKKVNPATGELGQCWYRCTVSGGRVERDIDVAQVCKAVEKLGAGEILVNCIDEDGQGRGFDIELVGLVKSCVSIPVIASSGAGNPNHFVQVFKAVDCEAALAAGIFHREEVSIQQVKSEMFEKGIVTRLT